MRFRCTYDNATWVVKPRYRVVTGLNAENIPGLRAEFHAHLFDSERAQKTFHWTDEEREKVEGYLQEHDDFQTGIIQLDAPAAATAAVGPPMGQGCLFPVPLGDGEIEYCGATIEDGIYCPRHLAMVNEAEVNEPAVAADA